MRFISGLACLALSLAATAPAAAATTVLFVGNSFTYGQPAGGTGPSVDTYKPFLVTDLNGTSIGGVPALFKEFTVQMGLDYSVSLETVAGSDLDYHYDNKLGVIDQPWDVVVLQSHSVLDPANPGDPTTLINSTGLLADTFYAQNPDVDIYLTATWSRADLTYRKASPWLGESIDAMAEDIQSGYEQAAAASPHVTDVIEVGGAWNDAMSSGFADVNPYDGLDAGKINLWAPDEYHASPYGYYLSALMQFGAITGEDPRLLGANETAAAYFNFTPEQTVQLQSIAYDRLMQSSSAVPEPSTWAMLLLGFGAIGGTVRRRRAVGTLALAQAA